MGKLLHNHLISWRKLTVFNSCLSIASDCNLQVSNKPKASRRTVYPKKYVHGFCFVVVIHWLIFPYPSGLLQWRCGDLTIAPVPAKQPRWIWINTSCEFIMNDCITTTKQSTTKPCAYFLRYTVPPYYNFVDTCINSINKNIYPI